MMASEGGALQQAKLVLLGDMGAGKSSVVLRFVKGQFFDYQVSPPTPPPLFGLPSPFHLSDLPRRSLTCLSSGKARCLLCYFLVFTLFLDTLCPFIQPDVNDYSFQLLPAA